MLWWSFRSFFTEVTYDLGNTFKDLVTQRESQEFLRTHHNKEIFPTKKFFEATQICCTYGSNCIFEPDIQVQLSWLKEKTATLSVASRVCVRLPSNTVR